MALNPARGLNTAHLTGELVRRIGLSGLSNSELRQIEASVIEAVEVRVGARLSRMSTPAQLAEFELLIHAGSSDAEHWLAGNIPQYPAIVQHEARRVIEDAVSNFTKGRP